MGKKSSAKLVKLIKKKLDEIEKINDKYYKIGKSDLEYIARKTVDEFYDDYEPLMYERYGDLYNAYKLTASKQPNGMFSFEILYDWSFMHYTHRVSNEYIYENSFIYGWHGGARTGPNHPNSGEAWWREPSPYYTNWKSPASQSEPVKEKIRTRLERHLSLLQIEMQKEYNNKIVSSIKSEMDVYLKG